MVVVCERLRVVFCDERVALVNGGRGNLERLLRLNKIIFLGLGWFGVDVKGGREKELFGVIFGCIVDRKLFFGFVKVLGGNSADGLNLNLGFFLFHPVPTFLI